jgi:sec-independent protein translocase protein TatC
MSEPENDVGEVPLLDLLEKVRWRLFKSLAALLAGFVVGFLLVHYLGVTEILVRPIRPFLEHQEGRLAAFSPLTPFLLELKVALIVAVILAFPVIVYQVWGHVSPSLGREERRVILPSLFVGIFLFAAGVGAAYWVLPWSFRWLFAFQADYVDLVIGADDYLSFVLRLLVAFGVVFEMPVVVMILTTLGLVTPRFLREKRRHAVVVITVLASLITPGDLPSTFMMMAPMLVLYELSIVLSQAIHRRREEERSSDEAKAGEQDDGADLAASVEEV